MTPRTLARDLCYTRRDCAAASRVWLNAKELSQLCFSASFATGLDTPRPVATGRDADYILSLEDVSERYAKAGHLRTLGSLQRYWVNGHLDA
jgi:hypothetical protein